MANETKVLDYSGLSYFWSQIKDDFVSDVVYDTTTKKFSKTRKRDNDATIDIVTAATLKSDMDLDQVGNFKAVSTVASQGLQPSEKEAARGNIGAGTVTGVSYDTTYKKFKQTTTDSTTPTTDIVTAATLKSDMNLDQVGNFKAVSTVSGQELSIAEKAAARTNIGAGTSNFSGSYNDLTDKPDIAGVYRYKGSVASVANLPTHSSTPAPVNGDVWNVESTGKNYAYVEYNTTTGEDVWDDLGGEFAITPITNAEIDTIIAS